MVKTEPLEENNDASKVFMQKVLKNDGTPILLFINLDNTEIYDECPDDNPNECTD